MHLKLFFFNKIIKLRNNPFDVFVIKDKRINDGVVYSALERTISLTSIDSKKGRRQQCVQKINHSIL
jgi:hypothetical protein